MIGAAARTWCETMSCTLPVRHILREGRPYLDRYDVGGWSPRTPHHTGTVYLHHFLASDAAAAVHSHPWTWALSLILVGGYREHRCRPDGTWSTREFWPGDLNVLEASDRHRIELLEADCWSLFLAGAPAQAWRFESIDR